MGQSSRPGSRPAPTWAHVLAGMAARPPLASGQDERVIPAAEPEPDALAFAFTGGRILVHADLAVPLMGVLAETARLTAGPILLGRLSGRPCYAVALEEGPGAELTAIGLRELFARVEDPAVVSMA